MTFATAPGRRNPSSTSALVVAFCSPGGPQTRILEFLPFGLGNFSSIKVLSILPVPYCQPGGGVSKTYHTSNLWGNFCAYSSSSLRRRMSSSVLLANSKLIFVSSLSVMQTDLIMLRSKALSTDYLTWVKTSYLNIGVIPVTFHVSGRVLHQIH